MKLCFTNEWLRDRIKEMPDVECDAGLPLDDAESIRKFASGDLGDAHVEPGSPSGGAILHILIHQLRRRDKVSINEFAKKVRIEANEVELIESNPDYVPRPRTVHNLAEYMGVSPAAVQRLTSEFVENDNDINEAALKFAASSKDLSALTKAERRSLNNFVKFLSHYKPR